jgi:drug/metabolite transporter (DMT)-like permease
MTPGIGLALGAMLCFGMGDLLYKRAAQAGIESRHFIMLQAWAFCPTITLYALLTDNLHVRPSAIWGGLAGLFALVAFYNFSQSLRTGTISANAPIFRLNFTVTAFLAIVLLGEPITLLRLMGLTLALVAVWLLLAEPQGSPSRPSLASLTRVLIATGALAFANLFYKVGLLQGARPETLLSAQAWVFCSLATAFVFVVDRRLHASPKIWRYSGPTAALLVVGFVLLLHGLLIGHASVLIPVAQLGFVVTALVGGVLFAESMPRRKQVGIGTAAGALVLLAVG